MKTTTHIKLGPVAAAAFCCMLAGAQAGSFVSDFNSALPTDAQIYGDAALVVGGGYTNSGYVQLTPDVASKAGSFVITNDLDAGVPVVSFTASFKVLIGGGDRFGYGDGMSFNFAPDVPLGSDSLAEQGVGSGLRVGMRTTKDAGAPNPAISVSGAGAAVFGSPAYVDNLRANTFVDMVVQLNPDNTVSVVYDGVYLYTNAPLGYWPGAGSLFWIGARTGGSREKHSIDNLRITTRTLAAPFLNTFAPQGRKVPAIAPLNVVLTDYSSQVNTNTIVLKLDGVALSPTLTQDGLGNTTVSFAPPTPFAAASRHSVNLTFADNSLPTAETQTFSWEFTVAEAVPANFVTVFSENFESYALGTLDKNAGGANAAPDGSGNPWFGPWPDNYTVVGSQSLTVESTNVAVTPHSGAKMIVKSYPEYTCTIWLNLAYRFHGGWPIRGNCRLDWWSFDAHDPATTFKDYASLYFYNPGAYAPAITVPQTKDWPTGWNAGTDMYWGQGFAWGDTDYQSLSLGASGYSQNGGYYNPARYQIRSEEMASGVTYGIDGWVNSIERSQGWHHYRILMGPPHTDGTVMVYFYIDDMVNPVFSDISTIAAQGITLLEIDSLGKKAVEPATPVPAYYDDISFALVLPPNLVATRSGRSVVLTWPGEGFTLQKADSVTGGWSDVTGASSGYSYDATTAAGQFFRLRN